MIFIYPRWQISSADAVAYLYPLAAVAAIAALFTFRYRIGSQPFVAVASFALSLVPAMGFFNVYPMRFSFVADHFQYFASIGIIGLAAGAGHSLLERMRLRVLRVPLGAALVVALALTARVETAK